MSVYGEKSPRTGSSRLSFLRTKRAIGAISLVLVVAIVLIALGATHTIGPHASSDEGKGANGASSSQTTSSPTGSSTSQSTGSLANGTPLRVMCLGASVVKGETSPGTIGFRKVLRGDLAGFGNPVNMVGSVRLGDMIDNDLEAYGGVTIKTIFGYAKKIVPKQLPNIFVVNAGTNNILQNVDVDKTGEQMKDFIDYLLETSPKSVVILSTLLTNTVVKPSQWCGAAMCEDLVLRVNAQFRSLMPAFEKEGKHVVLAEIHPSEGGGDEIPQITDIGPDGSHPLVRGYEKMGHIYAKAIAAADSKGWIQEAADNGIPADGEAERSSSRRRRR